MKQLIPVILFTSFLLNNYAKQIRYVQCTVINAVSVGAPCNCLVVSQLNKVTNQKNAPIAAATLIQVYDVYFYTSMLCSFNTSTSPSQLYQSGYFASIASGFIPKAFRPPNV